MDQRLILALENLGNALEEIALSLQSKEKPKTSGVEALKAGDFGKQLESINRQLTSIKADTQAILREQKTIQSMSKQKDSGKGSPMEDIGKDKKKESSLKKGLGTILLIAVAVLAIGMAFKLVGKIDFLSVVALGLAIYVVAEAFAKIAALNLSIKQAFVTSLAMVLMSVAITLSSFILARITPIGMTKLMTAVAIAGVFAVIGLSLVKLAEGFEAFYKIMGRKALIIVPLVMLAISLGVVASSRILTGIVPVGIAKLMTAAGIAVVFAIMGLSLDKLATGFVTFDKILGKKAPIIVPAIMVAIAGAITASSHVMAGIRPIGILQALTAIAIAVVFAIMGISLEKIARSINIVNGTFGSSRKAANTLTIMLVAIATALTASSAIMMFIAPLSFKQMLTAVAIAIVFTIIGFAMVPIAIAVVLIQKILGKKNLYLIPLVLVAIATSIMAASRILSLTKPMSIFQFLTALGITILFGIMSFFLVPVAYGVYLVDKILGGKAQLILPAVFLAISIAIMISSHILSKSAKMGLSQIINLTAFGIGLGLMVLAMLPSVLAVGIATASGVGAGAILLGVGMIPLIALAVAVSSHILAEGNYDNYPGLGWVASVGIIMGVFTLVVLELGISAMTGIGLVAILAGVLLVPLIAKSIVDTAAILNTGEYGSYPSLSWIFNVGLVMTGFGIAVLALGILAVTGIGLVAILAGVLLVPLIAKSIVDTAARITTGKYGKYPSLSWIFNVGLVMTGFGIAVLALGILAVTGVGLVAILAGVLLVPLIAKAIVDTAARINAGNYGKYPSADWIAKVGAVMTGFGIAVLALGILAVTGVGLVAILAGVGLVPLIAKAIVDTAARIATGKYEKYPGAFWILSVGILMIGFGAAVLALGLLAVTGIGLIAILAGVELVPLIAKSIVATSKIIAGGKYEKGPSGDWALAVGGLMTVFGLAVLTLGSFIVGSLGFGYVALKAGQKAVTIIAQSIVDVAKIFSTNAGFFVFGPKKEWAEGVGIAIGAFAPVYEMLMKGGIMQIFTGSGPSPDEFATAIRTISQGIVDAALFFNRPEAKAGFINGPPKAWAEGVGGAIGAFAPVLGILMNEKGWFGSGVSVKDFKKAIKTISYGIIASAGIFSTYKSRFDTYPSVEWAQGVGGALGAFAPVFTALNKAGFFNSGEKIIANMLKGITSISQSIVDVAKKFAKQKNWSIYPGQLWNYNVKMTLANYATMSKTHAKFNVYNDVIPDMTAKIVEVASIFYKNKKFFDSGLVANITKWTEQILGPSGVFSKYVLMAKFLDAQEKAIKKATQATQKDRSLLSYLLPTSKRVSIAPPTFSNSTGDIVADTALKLVRVASILHQGEKFFKLKLDPDYMKRVGKNILDFNHIVMMLAKSEAEGVKIGKISNELLGDPISRIATRMLILAGAYDKLASSLMKLGSAMRMLNIRDARMLGGITTSIVNYRERKQGEIRPPNSIERQRREAPTEVREPEDEFKGRRTKKPLDKEERLFKKMDDMLTVLKSINRSVSSVDEYIASVAPEIVQGEEKGIF